METTKIRGIGAQTAEILKNHGFDSIALLANTDAQSLAQVPGFSIARATTIIAAAQELLSKPLASEKTIPVTETITAEPAKVKKEKTKKNKGKGKPKPKKETDKKDKKKDKKKAKKKKKSKK